MSTLSRRQFIRTSGLAALGLPLLLEACGGTASVASSSGGVAAAASGSTGSAKPAGSAATGGGFKAPSYVPFQGPKPDIAGNDQGLPPAYFSFPKDLTKSVATPPGKGGDVNMLDFTNATPPPGVSDNPSWQEVNKQIGANLKINAVGAPDYMTKLATITSGGDLPDMFYVSVIGA
ncbi:MAG TPA: hypothetical protein VFS62_09275, partial [Chloroflexota bacterium]|nr:hypothetical protein [Chloroflexota bacterium]